MNNRSERKLRVSLEKLIQVLYEATTTALVGASPEYSKHITWRVSDFEYNDGGVTLNYEVGEAEVPEFSSVVSATLDRVEGLAVHRYALQATSEFCKTAPAECKHLLRILLAKVARRIVQEKIERKKMPSAADCRKYVTFFIKDLKGESQECRIEVQLDGIILQPDLIELGSNESLRKPTTKDFERDVRVYPPLPVWPLDEIFSALLQMKVYARRTREIESEIEKRIAILRLFRLGAVRDIRYTIDTDSIISLVGGVRHRSGRLESSSSYKYLVAEHDVESLRAFWSSMKRSLPLKFIRPDVAKETREISIARGRYNDALNVETDEKCISSAVMGMEALYLLPDEQDELSYRLRIRASKLLALIGYNYNDVRQVLKDAYTIRSIYVHGGMLTRKQIHKISERYGQLKQLSRAVTDYLRASIVAWTRISSKDSLIRDIDNSFLDSRYNDKVRSLLFIPY